MSFVIVNIVSLFNLTFVDSSFSLVNATRSGSKFWIVIVIIYASYTKKNV